MPRVSVIIPTYNRAGFVREALASACAQSYRDCEIVVVDDGSGESCRNATRQTVEAFAAEANFPVLYCFQRNQGVSSARNSGVRISQGELIAFLDSDDIWQPEKLQEQASFFDSHPEVQICQTDEIWLRSDARVNPKKKHRKPKGNIFFASLGLCLVSPSATMMRRTLFEHLGGFDETLPACEDYDLWLRISVTESVFLIESPLVLRRGGHGDQLSGKYWGMDRFRITALCKLLDSGQLSPRQRTATREMLRKKVSILLNGARKRGRPGHEWKKLAAVYALGK